MRNHFELQVLVFINFIYLVRNLNHSALQSILSLFLTQRIYFSYFWQHSRFGDPFLDAWRAFTSNDILSLSHLVGKKVCIPDATFAFLPRMAYGLFYSTYLVRM